MYNKKKGNKKDYNPLGEKIIKELNQANQKEFVYDLQ